MIAVNNIDEILLLKLKFTRHEQFNVKNYKHSLYKHFYVRLIGLISLPGIVAM